MQVLHVSTDELLTTTSRRKCLTCAEVDFVTTIEEGLYTCPFCLRPTGVEHVLPGHAWLCGDCRIPFRRGPLHSLDTFKALVPQQYTFDGYTLNGVPKFMSLDTVAQAWKDIEVHDWSVIGSRDSLTCDPTFFEDDLVDFQYPSEDEEKMALLTIRDSGSGSVGSGGGGGGGSILKLLGHVTHYFETHPQAFQRYVLRVIQDQQLEILDLLLVQFASYFDEKNLQRSDRDEFIRQAIQSDNYAIYKRFIDLFKITFDLVPLNENGDQRHEYLTTYYLIYEICKHDRISILHGLFGETPGRIFPVELAVAAMDLVKPQCAQYLFENAVPQVFRELKVNLNLFSVRSHIEGGLVIALDLTRDKAFRKVMEENVRTPVVTPPFQTFTSGPHIYE